MQPTRDDRLPLIARGRVKSPDMTVIPNIGTAAAPSLYVLPCSGRQQVPIDDICRSTCIGLLAEICWGCELWFVLVESLFWYTVHCPALTVQGVLLLVLLVHGFATWHSYRVRWNSKLVSFINVRCVRVPEWQVIKGGSSGGNEGDTER